MFYDQNSVDMNDTLSHSTMENASQSQDPIEHVVLCWLKDKNVEDVTALLLEKSQKLRSIPGITSFRSGNVVKSSRDIVDDSFNVGFVMGFGSKKAMEEYLVHPLHVSFVNDTLKPVLDKVVVYDIQLN